MKKELQLDHNRKMVAGIVAGVQRTYLPQMDLAILRALVVVGVLFVHPISAVLVSLYVLLWYLLPKQSSGQIRY